ncbi:MAG TPA: BON domain-containing protein [Chitinispirillaceae bacterium]|jgi:osmotically-inducible protein OsmY|nr:BON domain-containing protein [Chitinispirillaceae bacterium]
MAFSKEEIKKNIVDQLFWDSRVDASGITIEFLDGTVVLSGTAPTWLARQAAEQDAWAVPGVSAVRNDITVRFPSGHPLPSDEEIKGMVTNVLSWDSNIDNSDILVTVENGRVTLDGTVPAYWQKVHAREIVLNVQGVVSVNNRLAVVPAKHYVDELIARDIEAALDRSTEIDVNDVDVQVDNGKVVLMGDVKSRVAYEVAERIARNTDGVTDVINNLVII